MVPLMSITCFYEVSWLIFVIYVAGNFGQEREELGLLALMLSLVALIEKLMCSGCV